MSRWIFLALFVSIGLLGSRHPQWAAFWRDRADEVEELMMLHGKDVVLPSRPKLSREDRVRAILERICQSKFVKVRPPFLKNPETNACLELDCYNANLKLAVEVNGAHHYHFTPYFHSTVSGFERLKKTDALKKQLCEAEGVRLLIVPYTVPDDQLEDYLVNLVYA